MTPTVALALCTVLVAALLLIERKGNVVSWAVWVPTAWMLICGSRAVATWSLTAGYAMEETAEAGSPLDRLVLTVLLTLAIFILLRRKVRWSQVLKDNAWLLVLFLYMAMSIMWSEFPFVSSKRWIRAFGPVLMALVIFSEQAPLQAFETVFKRTAYILIPFSLVLVKYYPLLGVRYGRWDGQQMWTGVTTHKNSLGQLCAVSVFLIVWGTLRKWRLGKAPSSKFQLLADILVVAIGLFLLRGPAGSYSATSIAILVIGSATVLLLYRVKTFARVTGRHLTSFTILSVVLYWLLSRSLMGLATSTLGRDETLTGRTDIWKVVSKVAAQSPIIGLGYGGFWGLHPAITSQLQVGESHNGYLDVYVELGIIGIVLLAIFFLAYCRRVRKAFDRTFDWSVLAVCFLLLTLLYNLSESAFLTNGFLWTTMIFLAIVFSSAEAPATQLAVQGRNARVLGRTRRPQGRSPHLLRTKRARHPLAERIDRSGHERIDRISDSPKA